MTRNYAYRMLDDAVRLWPQREALVHDGQRWSYARLERTVRSWAGTLRTLIRPGGDVALLCGNQPELVAVQLAAHLLGCRFVAISPAVSPEATDRILRDIAPQVLVLDATLFPDRAAELREAARPRHLLSLGPAPFGQDLLAAPPPPHGDREQAAPGELVRTVFLTSGTTGQPKAVQHGHELYRSLRALIGERGLVTPGERRLVCTPPAYISGHFVLPTLMSGGTLVLHNGFDAAAVQALAAERINVLLVNTVILDRFLAEPGFTGAQLPHLRRIQYGAARCSPRRLGEAIERFGPVLQQVYGLTEAGVVSLLQPEDHDPARPRLLASVGFPVPGVRVDIHQDDGQPVATGQRGEVCVQSPVVRESRLGIGSGSRPLDGPGGWLRTGDLGYLDDDGRLHIIERIKDLILEARTGLRVWLGEVEEALHSHPSVHSAAVVGVPAVGSGEWVRAVVIPVAGADPDTEELRAHVRQVLRYEPAVPDRIRVIDSLPLTATGKVDKQALRRALSTQGGEEG
ncbi:AMP-binding protein [Streptomyces buecherae]|uniref:AMP-binding protein n=1 Tax=Streptomyces buecherae TaxID=2763006 RepID=A0A7H8NGN8_9ACTN|nr:AMP-binding protein [Streptomyces buecherae]QKW53631.1 AMP-binding protein [Streptomyces buecherae]